MPQSPKMTHPNLYIAFFICYMEVCGWGQQRTFNSRYSVSLGPIIYIPLSSCCSIYPQRPVLCILYTYMMSLSWSCNIYTVYKGAERICRNKYVEENNVELKLCQTLLFVKNMFVHIRVKVIWVYKKNRHYLLYQRVKKAKVLTFYLTLILYIPKDI